MERKERVLRIVYTRGDYCTQPGGIILREFTRGDDVEYAVHTFNRDYGSKTPREFYWGHYRTELSQAKLAFQEKYDRASRFDLGGSLIPSKEIDRELEKERLEHAST